MGNQLLGRTVPANEVVRNELNDASCVRVGLIVEVQSISRLLNVDRFLVRIVTQNQLLQEEERTLVRHSLANLHLTCPLVRRPRLLAVVALLVLNHELHAKGLLQQRACLHFLLNRELELDSPAVGLGVNKLRVQ